MYAYGKRGKVLGGFTLVSEEADPVACGIPVWRASVELYWFRLDSG
jgi:hypothetical protein